MKIGRLIVIEGGDGSGKTVQAKMLVEYLKKNHHPAEYFDFPQYYHSFYGDTVAKFLRGEFGNIESVSPYLASLPFALDRAGVKDKMQELLNKGVNIIANRYATSNLIYQAAKFSGVRERDQFIGWISQLEYQVHGIPKEDLVIYLDVPWRIGLQLTQKKGPRAYLHGHDDIHENHHRYRRKVEKLYLEMINKKDNWYKISCVVENKLLIPEKIQQKIIGILRKKSVI